VIYLESTKGVLNRRAKLTANEVRWIYRSVHNGVCPREVIALLGGVISRTAVSEIRHRKRYREELKGV